MFEEFYINIVMVGEIGVGKLFLINIFVIVLVNKKYIKDIYRILLK